jgi:hypothetical protein
LRIYGIGFRVSGFGFMFISLHGRPPPYGGERVQREGGREGVSPEGEGRLEGEGEGKGGGKSQEGEGGRDRSICTWYLCKQFLNTPSTYVHSTNNTPNTHVH